MTTTGSATTTLFNDSRLQKRQPLIPNSLFGMGVFVVTEVMFFTALVSAYLVIKGGSNSWVIPEGIKLPVLNTAFNTGVLIVSGALLYVAGRKMRGGNPASARSYLLRTIFLGSFFVLFQGYEWVNLISFGMTMKSGIFAACFFLLIGCHGLHAVSGILGLGYLYVAKKDTLSLEALQTMQIFWYFVVGVWPLLYGLVYF